MTNGGGFPRQIGDADDMVGISSKQQPTLDDEWDQLSQTEFELRYEIRQLRAACWSYARDVAELREEVRQLRQQLVAKQHGLTENRD